MTFEDVVSGLASYGSGFALGLGFGVAGGFYLSLFVVNWYLRWKFTDNPSAIVKTALKKYRELNGSLFEAEKMLDFPESVDELEEETIS